MFDPGGGSSRLRDRPFSGRAARVTSSGEGRLDAMIVSEAGAFILERRASTPFSREGKCFVTPYVLWQIATSFKPESN